MIRSWFAIVVVALSPLGVAQNGPPDVPDIAETAELEAFVDGVVGSSMHRHNTAGTVVAIIKDDEILLAKGYGYADVAGKTPVDPETTMFRIGSVTKLFTWTALMQLEEQGRLTLDGDVNDYLTSIQIPPTFAEPITIANLMTHTGGLEDRIIGLFALDASAMKPYAELLTVDLPDRVRPPGWVSSYSNHGVGVAGLIVEDVSGLSWPEYVESHILEPLGMRNSTAHQPVPESLARHSSTGYQFAAGRFKEKPFEYVPLGAAGGMSASALDMMEFAKAHLNDGAHPGGRILKAESARRMREALFKPHSELPGWLHGFADYTRNDVFIYGHSGGTFYFFTQFALFPEQKLGIFMSTNTAGGGLVNVALFEALMDRYFPIDYAAPESTSGSDLASFAGTYATFRHPVTTLGKLLRLTGTVRVTATGEGELMLTRVGQDPSYWRETSPGVFRNVDRPRTLEFVVDEAGQLLFIGSAGGSFYMLTGLHSPTFQYAAMGVSLVLLCWAVVAWPIQRIRRGGSLAGVEHRSRIVAWLMALTIVATLAGVSLNASQDIVYAVPSIVSAVLWVPFLTLALLLAYAFLLVGLVRDSAVAMSTKVFHAVLAVSAALVCWLFVYWNLIGG